MKKIGKTAIVTCALIVSVGLIGSLATAAINSGQKGFGQYDYHGKISALKLDYNKDGALSQKELLSHNNKRFRRLDSNEDGTISKDEFNARLTAMFEKMDSNSDGILKGDEMPQNDYRRRGRHAYRENQE